MKLNKKTLNIFLIICIMIIFFETLNSLLGVRILKNVDLQANITILQIDYFSSVIIFIIFSLYNYTFYEKIKVDIVYKGVFSLFIISNILFKLFVYPKTTIFCYFSIILQFILLICIITYNERLTK